MTIPFYIAEFSTSPHKNVFESLHLNVLCDLSVKNNWQKCLESIITEWPFSYQLPASLLSDICIQQLFNMNDSDLLTKYHSITPPTPYFYLLYQQSTIFSQQITTTLFTLHPQQVVQDYIQTLLQFPFEDTHDTWVALLPHIPPTLPPHILTTYLYATLNEDIKDYEEYAEEYVSMGMICRRFPREAMQIITSMPMTPDALVLKYTLIGYVVADCFPGESAVIPDEIKTIKTEIDLIMKSFQPTNSGGVCEVLVWCLGRWCRVSDWKPDYELMTSVLAHYHTDEDVMMQVSKGKHRKKLINT